MAGLSTTQITFIAAGVVALAGYVGFILAPAWTSYGRVWERVAASFLTLFILATLVGIGIVLGLAIAWGYTELS